MPTKRRYSGSKIFSQEQQQFIRDTYCNISQDELFKKFVEKFGPVVKQSQISSFVHNHHINSGRTGRFQKGSESWNRGKKGYMGANATSFKKGNLPHNHRPLYSERVDSKSGLLLISVPEPNPYTGFPTRYKHKHVWIWEQANGPRPAGKCIIFIDGNNRNFNLDNLACVSRAELLVLNHHNYSNRPADLFPSLLALAQLELKAKIRTRPGRGRS